MRDEAETSVGHFAVRQLRCETASPVRHFVEIRLLSQSVRIVGKVRRVQGFKAFGGAFSLSTSCETAIPQVA